MAFVFIFISQNIAQRMGVCTARIIVREGGAACGCEVGCVVNLAREDVREEGRWRGESQR